MFEQGECPCRPDLEAFWDDELDALTRDGVLRHLEDCPRCAVEDWQQEQLTLLIRVGDPAEALPPRTVQRLRGDLLQRAGASLLGERLPIAVRPKRLWGPLQTFFALGSGLATVWLVSQRTPHLPPEVPAVQVSKQAQTDPQRRKPREVLRDASPAVPEKPLPRPNRLARMPSPHAPSRPFEVAAAARIRVTTNTAHAAPVGRVHPLRAPAVERLVIDMSRPAGLPPPRVASVLLIANGSPDSADGESVIVRSDAVEETP